MLLELLHCRGAWQAVVRWPVSYTNEGCEVLGSRSRYHRHRTSILLAVLLEDTIMTEVGVFVLFCFDSCGSVGLCFDAVVNQDEAKKFPTWSTSTTQAKQVAILLPHYNVILHYSMKYQLRYLLPLLCRKTTPIQGTGNPRSSLTRRPPSSEAPSTTSEDCNINCVLKFNWAPRPTNDP